MLPEITEGSCISRVVDTEKLTQNTTAYKQALQLMLQRKSETQVEEEAAKFITEAIMECAVKIAPVEKKIIKC